MDNQLEEALQVISIEHDTPLVLSNLLEFRSTERNQSSVLGLTQDDWCVAMEKCVEEQPDVYLRFHLVWIRLRNRPVNYYTKKYIKEIAAGVGKVIKCPFHAEKSKSQDYMRVRVLFDVSQGLRNSKKV
ncbi:hypothetical protein AtEden1_Chr4g0279481 [Arabidopsis thaliana]